MRLLVTGATGFIGRQVCVQAKRNGWVVRAAVRGNATLPNDIDPFVLQDLDATVDWSRALVGVDTVIHLAARAHVLVETAPDSLSEYLRVNVEATLNLAEQAAIAKVKRFVFISSIGVNGNVTDKLPFTERDIPNPRDFYAVSKLQAEQGLYEISKKLNLDIVIIRPPLVYGPGAKGNWASFVRWVRRGVPLPLGAIDNRRSFVALDNLVSFIILCADPVRSAMARNQVFLISDDDELSTPELIRKVAKAYGVTSYLLTVPESWLRFCARWLGKTALTDRLFGSLVVDSSKARQWLGWQPVVSMDEQLKKMAQNDKDD
jgi:nucleoside-diphosphate-sugar epimerase